MDVRSAAADEALKGSRNGRACVRFAEFRVEIWLAKSPLTEQSLTASPGRVLRIPALKSETFRYLLANIDVGRIALEGHLIMTEATTSEVIQKSNVQRIRCVDWNDFKKRVIEEQFPDRIFQKGRFLFRGQGSDSWKLSTSFDRWYKGNKSDKNAGADSLLTEFKVECEFEEMPEILRSDRLAMLGLAQHHGLPTRLLDWSESPYVAAFFAYSGHVRQGLNFEKHVAVWVLDAGSKVWNEENGCTLVKVPALWNQRIRNQFGRFTYLRTMDDTLEDYVNHFDESEVTLKKYIIPVNDLRLAMSELDAMGLTHARIYPGLEGNARAAEVRVTLRQLT